MNRQRSVFENEINDLSSNFDRVRFVHFWTNIFFEWLEYITSGAKNGLKFIDDFTLLP